MTHLTILNLFTMFCCMAICLRLLLFRRSGSRFKRSYSLIAWVIIVITGGLGLSLLVGKLTVADLNPLVIVSLIILLTAVWLARGNVARMLHISRWYS